MAAFLLYLRGNKTGGRRRRDEAEDGVGIYVDDVPGLKLVRDQYADQEWCGAAALDELAAGVERCVAERRRAAEQQVLAESKRARLEPWMDARIAELIAADRLVPSLEELLALVRRARAENGLMFFGAD